MKKIKWIAALGIAVLLISILAACGGDRASTAESSGDTSDKIKVVAATSGAPTPDIYNDNGKLYGYEIEVLEEVFSRLPQYELEWEITEFTSIFTGIDAGYYQIGVNQFGYTTERAEKYLFSDLISIAPFAIIVRDDNDEINSIYDLPGHSTEVSVTSFHTTAYENYNEDHPDSQIDLIYVDDVSQTPLHVSDGIVDFEFYSKTTLLSQIESLGLTNFKIIDVTYEDQLNFLFNGVMTSPDGCYFLLAKGEEQLLADINAAFEEAVLDGTVQALGEKYHGVTDETALTIKDIEDARTFIENDQKSLGQ